MPRSDASPTSAPLTVVIATSGRAQSLAATLQSLSRCTLPPSYSGTIIAENGERCGTEATVSSAAARQPRLKLRYLHVERANKSHALNVALQTLQGHLAFFSDDDIEFDPALLMHYAEAAAGYRGGRVYGGALKVRASGIPNVQLRRYMPPSMTGFSDIPPNPAEVHFLGANWAAYVDDIHAVGGYDIRYGPGSETGAAGNETSMMIALRRLGCSFHFLPEAIVHHAVDFDRIDEKLLLRRRYSIGVRKGLELASAVPPGKLFDRSRLTLVSSRLRLLWQRMRLSWLQDENKRRTARFKISRIRGIHHGWRAARGSLQQR